MWVTLPVLFVAVAVVMAGPGELVAACFPLLERLDAYRWDLVGSLAGIAGFTALSLLRAPSVVWAIVVAVLSLVLLRPRPPVLTAAALVGLVGVLLVRDPRPGRLVVAVLQGDHRRTRRRPGRAGRSVWTSTASRTRPSRP